MNTTKNVLVVVPASLPSSHISMDTSCSSWLILGAIVVLLLIIYIAMGNSKTKKV
jgi:hypothetical protein